jgi:hypothetical protein
MRKLYLFAAMAAMLAACSSDDLTVEKQSQQAQQNSEQAVDFDVYVNRGLTRGGISGPIANTTVIQTGSHKDAGFGVFGYYTDGERYSGITKPNFFYNQQVTYGTTTGWTYTPKKYWPNEFGSDAISDQVDRVTLFAYLPWVEVDPLTGTVKPAVESELTGTDEQKAIMRNQKDPTTNIIGMSRNNVTGDPFVKYVATMDATNSVDLCYAVAAEDFTSSNSALNKNNIKKGEPYIDVVKPGLDGKIKFDFKHATAQLKVTVDAVVNAADISTGANVESDYTRIWIRSVTFEGITQKGALNLNGGEWYDMNGTNKITTGSLTLFDGRKDGKEAILAATNETPSSINYKLVQSSAYELKSNGKIDKPAEPGVTSNPLNLFENGGPDAPVFVIPTNEKMKVTIVYDVETVDPNLAYYLSDGATQGSTIENSITKTIETFGNISAGYCYTLNLHLGMRTVDFDAVVTEWQDMQADVDLPSNVQAFAAATSETKSTVILPSGDTNYTYEFAITGLNVNEPVTATMASTDWITSYSNNSANGAGIALQSISVNKNTSTKNREVAGYARWKGNESNKTAAILFRQLGAPLGMSFAFWYGDKDIFLNSTAGNTAFSNDTGGDLTADANHIKVWKNGVLLKFGIDYSYTYNNPRAQITLTEAAKNDDNFKVYIQSGDAAAETLTFPFPYSLP